MPRRPTSRAAEAEVEEVLGETSVPTIPLDPTALRTHAVRVNPSKASWQRARAEKMKKRRDAIEAAKKYLGRRLGNESASRFPDPVEEPDSEGESASSDSSVASDDGLLMDVPSGSTEAASCQSPNCNVTSGTPESPETPPGLDQAAASSRRAQSGSSSSSSLPRRTRETIDEYVQTMSMLVMEDAEEAPILLPQQRRFSNRTLLPRKPTKAVKKLDYAKRMFASGVSLNTHNNGLLSACVHSACGSLCRGPRLLQLFERYWKYRSESKRLVFLTSFMVYKQEEGWHCFNFKIFFLLNQCYRSCRTNY